MSRNPKSIRHDQGGRIALAEPLEVVGADVSVGGVSISGLREDVDELIAEIDGATSESDLSLSDVTTGNATTERHGFMPKLSGNAEEFFNGAGELSEPAVGAGYLVYIALLSQSGTSAPVATVLENTLDGEPVISRGSSGHYSLVLEGGFPADRTSITPMRSDLVENMNSRMAYRADDDTVQILTSDVSGFPAVAAADDILSDDLIEIRVYPAPPSTLPNGLFAWEFDEEEGGVWPAVAGGIDLIDHSVAGAGHPAIVDGAAHFVSSSTGDDAIGQVLATDDVTELLPGAEFAVAIRFRFEDFDPNILLPNLVNLYAYSPRRPIWGLSLQKEGADNDFYFQTYDSSDVEATIEVTLQPDTWYLALLWKEGGSYYLQIDDGEPQTVAAPASGPTGLIKSLQVGGYAKPLGGGVFAEGSWLDFPGDVAFLYYWPQRALNPDERAEIVAGAVYPFS